MPSELLATLCLAAWHEQALGLAAGQAVAEPLSRFEGPADLDVVPAHEPCERGASIAEGFGALSAGKAEPYAFFVRPMLGGIPVHALSMLRSGNRRSP